MVHLLPLRCGSRRNSQFGVALFLFALLSSSWATTITWSGGTGDFSSDANWIGGVRTNTLEVAN